MALKKKPVNGMKDIMPDEMQIRDYVQSVIKETYRAFGFTPIETPCMEDIANPPKSAICPSVLAIFIAAQAARIADPASLRSV